MELLHESPFVGSLEAILDRDGSEARVAILKATYELEENGRLRIAENQEPIWPVDQHMGAAGSSVLYESDGAYHKPSADIVVVGSAFAPRGKPVTDCFCALAVGEKKKIIKVFGDRRWSYSRFSGATQSDPLPFVEMPLRWERAYGGADPQSSLTPDSWESRNPIGVGFIRVKTPSSVEGLTLPNFEDPRNLISSWKDRPTPQGMGFVGRSWLPRRRFAGTYDEAWRKFRSPVPPMDFDYRFFQAAPSDMIYPGYLRGGEPVRALHLTKRGDEQFQLPKIEVVFHAQSRRRALSMSGVLDTVVFAFAERRLSMVWRCKYPVSMNESGDEARADIRFLDAPRG